MTHVVHPYAHRIGILRSWKSRWFTNDKKKYAEYLEIDTKIREYLVKRLRGMYVSDIEIERGNDELRIIVKTSRPGVIIGRSGEGATKIRAELLKILKKMNLDEMPKLKLDISEVRSPESDASIVSSMVIEGLEKRMPFRRVLKQTVDKVSANRDTKGVRIVLSGRLGGAEMARKEELKRGRIPLQTLRADIDYAQTEAHLPYGVVGVKVWIYRGDIFEK